MDRSKFPSAYVIIFAVIVLCAVATWFVPGGRYVTDGAGAVTYEQVQAVPQTWQVASALYNGFCRQAGIIVFILVVGGAFWLLNATGAVTAGISSFIKAVRGHDRVVLASIAVLFSLGGAVFGMSEETIPFVGIVVPLVISMGYDATVGMLIVSVAANIGFSTAFLNPFTVGVAQEMSGLPLFSGMGYRLFCWAAFTAILVAFTLVYAGKVKSANAPAVPPPAVSGAVPGQSCGSSGGSSCGTSGPAGGDAPDGRQKAILATLLATVVLLIVGVTCWGWYMAEISALFLAMGIACGIIAGFSANRIADEFIAGAKDILSAALVVGLASGIVIILEDGRIMDSMLHALQEGLGDSSQFGSLTAMYGIQSLINLFIPSATAKAAVTIPIMAPFSDLIGLSRQATVLAFQFGDGFTNMITPTSGVLIASLAMARIPYAKWVRWAWKYVLALLALGFLFLIPTVIFSLSGF